MTDGGDADDRKTNLTTSLDMAKRQFTSYRKLIVIIVSLTVFYNEFFCYFYASLFWPTLSAEGPSDELLRILFVADPQIVGYQDDAYARPLSRKDCDRYLRNTFLYAVSHIKPDAIVFLGDILDEGSIAPDDHYKTYVQRVNYIFHTESNIPKVFIPGDNDVGGEGFDRKEEWKVKRFRENFVKPFLQQGAENEDIATIKFVDFMLMNIDMQDDLDQNLSKKYKARQGKFGFALNHMGLIDRYDISKIIQDISPDFIFTAHWHKARLYACSDCREPRKNAEKWHHMWHGQRIEMQPGSSAGSVYTFDLNARDSRVLEISVPTCSYRMGVPQMGYGAAVILESGSMKYAVLWLPSRYFCLSLYAGMAFVVALLAIFDCFCGRRQRRSFIQLYNKH